MSLRDEVKTLSGRKRRFFLLRVADMDADTARNLVGVTKGTYNTWLTKQDFVEIYRRRDELSAEYKQEAIQLLRRDNQLEAVLLEGKIIQKMKAELETGEYSLIRSHIAREVYAKLISGLDATPQTQVLSWEQRIQQIFNNPQVLLPRAGVIDGEYTEEVTNGQSEHGEHLLSGATG